MKVTSIKQAPVLKGHLSQKISYELNFFQEDTSLKRQLFLCTKGDPLIQV